MVVPGSFAGTTQRRARPQGISARATHRFRSFFRASKEGGYEAVRTLVEKLAKIFAKLLDARCYARSGNDYNDQNIAIDSLLTGPEMRNSHQYRIRQRFGRSSSMSWDWEQVGCHESCRGCPSE